MQLPRLRAHQYSTWMGLAVPGGTVAGSSLYFSSLLSFLFEVFLSIFQTVIFNPTQTECKGVLSRDLPNYVCSMPLIYIVSW